MAKRVKLPNFVATPVDPIDRFEKAEARAEAKGVKDSNVKHAVDRLKFKHLDGNTRYKDHLTFNPKVRFEREKNCGNGDADLHLRVNYVKRPSTIAQVIVPQAIFDLANDHPNKTKAGERLEVAARKAVLKSRNDGQAYKIVEKND